MSLFRIGVASWADPEFTVWYPKGLPKSEWLSYYAQHFDYVEVNTSFYAVPDIERVAHWSTVVPPDFLFDVKLHQLLSFHTTKPTMLPKDLRAMAETDSRGNVIRTESLVKAMAFRMLESVQPLIGAGKFGCFLLQLTPAFSPERRGINDLEVILDALGDCKVAVELRNRHWVVDDEQREQTMEFFNLHKIPMVLVDAPESSHTTVMPAMNQVTDPYLAYVRLHGRDEQHYLTGKTVATRFNYLYTEEELQQIARRSLALVQYAKKIHISCNNNKQDYALRAATRLRRILHSAS